MKVITWVDPNGRYRVTSPSYNDVSRPLGETEDECLERTWLALVESGLYDITADHPHFYVENADQVAKIATLGGSEFRYAGKPGADGKRDAKDGAWEMDTDGTPKVNMAKARGVQMDKIRVARNKELVKEDLNMLKALENEDASAQATVKAKKQELRGIPQTFDLTTDTPEELRAKWPEGLPKE